jgi:16S rRNA (adenine1518-N6/adenine1519-N6)-dimethyltransferase
MNKQQVLELLKSEGLSPNKMFGQNFLINKDITSRIVKAAEVTADDHVLEIGPGLGELTEVILAEGCSLMSVEIDAGLFRVVSKRFADNSRFTVMHSDFLKTENLGSFNKVVANLPYNCASEILFNCAEKYNPDLMCIMIQKEMAERIVSSPGESSYGAMTVMLSYLYSSKIAFNVPPSSFFPMPDITSSVIVMRKLQADNLSETERSLFGKIVKGAFWGRRKTMVKACSTSPHVTIDKRILLDAIRSIGLNDSIRGESLSTEQFIAITRFIISSQGSHDRSQN